MGWFQYQKGRVVSNRSSNPNFEGSWRCYCLLLCFLEEVSILIRRGNMTNSHIIICLILYILIWYSCIAVPAWSFTIVHASIEALRSHQKEGYNWLMSRATAQMGRAPSLDNGEFIIIFICLSYIDCRWFNDSWLLSSLQIREFGSIWHLLVAHSSCKAWDWEHVGLCCDTRCQCQVPYWQIPWDWARLAWGTILGRGGFTSKQSINLIHQSWR